MERFFVNQKKHNRNTDAWDNNCHVKDTYDAAMHQYHAFMSTYGYGQNGDLDYVACDVQDAYGKIVISEVDNKVVPGEEQ